MTTVITSVASRQRPATFAADMDGFIEQVAAFSEDVNADVTNRDAAVAAVNAGMGAATWTAGTYSIGTLKFGVAAGRLWRRTVATASATDPDVDSTGWALMTLPAFPLTVSSSTTLTGVANYRHEMTNSAACTFTLPASPVAGDTLVVGFTNGRTDNVIARNGSNIMSAAEDMTVDIPYFCRVMQYVDATRGWRFYR